MSIVASGVDFMPLESQLLFVDGMPEVQTVAVVLGAPSSRSGNDVWFSVALSNISVSTTPSFTTTLNPLRNHSLYRLFSGMVFIGFLQLVLLTLAVLQAQGVASGWSCRLCSRW